MNQPRKSKSNNRNGDKISKKKLHCSFSVAPEIQKKGIPEIVTLHIHNSRDIQRRDVKDKLKQLNDLCDLYRSERF